MPIQYNVHNNNDFPSLLLPICTALHNTTSWRWSNGCIVPNGSFNLSWRVTVDGSCQNWQKRMRVFFVVGGARQEMGRRRVRISSNTTLITTQHNIDVYTHILHDSRPYNRWNWHVCNKNCKWEEISFHSSIESGFRHENMFFLFHSTPPPSPSLASL